MTPLGIGVIGLGRWGQRYLQTLASLGTCRLAAAADSAGPGPSLHFPAGTAVYGTAGQLVADPSVEAAIVATPDHTHAAVTRLCLEAGKDVLVEKPMTLDPDSAHALVELAESSGRILAVGHTTLYHPGFAAMVDTVRGMVIGRISQATAARTSRGNSSASGSVVQDLLPHDLAMAVTLLGRPLAIRARIKQHGKAVSYQLAFAGDVIWAGRDEWRPGFPARYVRVRGELGSRRFSDTADHLRFPDMPLTRLCLDFIDSCRQRRLPLSTGRLGLGVVLAMQATADSVARGGKWTPIQRNRVSSIR